jgi:ribosomal protein S18 acetylase RimI-like enzyme
VTRRRLATGADAAFVTALVAADARERLGEVPGALREDLVALQVRAQQAHVAAHWPQAQDWVLLDGADHPVGRMLLGSQGADVHLLDLRVAAANRGRGVATRALLDLLQASARSGSAVRLHVQRDSPARRLYERLGFVALEGPDEAPDLAMRWQPCTGLSP